MKRSKPENMDVFNMLLACALFAVAGRSVSADEVFLHSGEVLNCIVVSKDAGQITVKHPILGDLKFSLESVKKIITDADKAKLIAKTKADTLAKEKTAKLAAAAKAKADVAAKVKAAAAAIAKQKADTAAKIEAAADKKKKDAAAKIKRIKDKEKAEIARLLKKEKDEAWRFHIDFGLNGQAGNSDTLDFRTNFRAESKDPTGRLRYEFMYYTRDSHGEKSANQFRAKVFRDFPMQKAKNWSLYVNGQYDFDEFRSYDYRLSGNGGFGYEFFKEKVMTLTGRIGLGMRREFADDTRPLKSESVLGLEYSWNLTPKQRITAKTTMYPDLTAIGEARTVSRADWTIKIDQDRGISLKFGLENEYESTTIGKSKHNDFKGMVSLGYDF